MDLLTEYQMQEIVSKMKQVVPFNINVMNNNGCIIASSDESRIGQIHPVALEALKSNGQLAVYEDTHEMRQGINTPIFFQGKPIGVVGITGEVEKVKDVIKLVKITAELLVNQEYLMNTKQFHKQIKEQFLYEWSYRGTAYNEDFINRGLSLDIDVTVERCAVVVYLPRENASSESASSIGFEQICERLDSGDYCIRLKNGKYAVFLTCNAEFERKIAYLEKETAGVEMGIGLMETNMHTSLLLAQAALKVGRILYPGDSTYRYEDLQFFCSIAESTQTSGEALATIEKLIADNNQYLLDTLIAFFAHNGEVNRVSQALHIHRNSLDYRMKRIVEITGKDPHRYSDLYYLYCAYLTYHINRAQ